MEPLLKFLERRVRRCKRAQNAHLQTRKLRFLAHLRLASIRSMNVIRGSICHY